MTASSTLVTFGIFPPSFPRDPIDVNVYMEHTLLGQVLEPLVVSGSDGSIQPGLATKWKFSNDGLRIDFQLRGDAVFSNGKPVTASDAKFSLQRHIESKNSQSKSYLNRIKEIVVDGSHTLTILLHSPYVAIFKSLSRDQLGILPDGWKFDASAEEPFIGTGAYRVIRVRGNWHLVRNERFHDLSSVQIKEAQVIVQTFGNDLQVVPDLAPVSTPSEVKEIERLATSQGKQMIVEPVPSFTQTSAWWYPGGKSAKDENRRRLGMQAVQELIELRAGEKQLKLATGVIPKGVPDHLAERAANTAMPFNDVKDRKFIVYGLASLFDVVNVPTDLRKVEEKFRVKIELHRFNATDFVKLVDLKPDVVFFGYAGGFHDPEGFLTVLTALLCSPIENIFGPAYPYYLEASSETDWAKRASQYQRVNRELNDSRQVVPGWKIPTFRVRVPSVELVTTDLRFSAKLKDFKIGVTN